MAHIIDSRIIRAESTLKTQPKYLWILFEGNFGSYFMTSGLSFSMDNTYDMQELDLLMELTDVMGKGWQSQLVGKEVRLMVEFAEESRGSCKIDIRAIGHRKYNEDEEGDDDLWIALNSKKQLLSAESAIEAIHKMDEEKNNK